MDAAELLGGGGAAGRSRRFVSHLIAHQALLRIAFIDLFDVGPAMVGRMTRSVADFTAMLTAERTARPCADRWSPRRRSPGRCGA